MPKKAVFILGGTVELSVAAYLLFGRNWRLKLALVTWLAVTFGLYRVGLWMIDPLAPCGCLGSLASRLNLTDAQAERIATACFWFILLGSILLTVAHWIRDRQSRFENGDGSRESTVANHG